MLGLSNHKKPSIENFWAALHPDDRKRIEALVAHSIKTHEDYAAEYRIITPDGEVRWIKALGEVCVSSEGQAIGMNGIVLDITSEKQALEKLAQMNFLMKSTEQMAKIGSWEYVAASQQTIWSDGEFGIFGISPGESPGYSDFINNFIHPQDAERVDQAFREAIQNGTGYDIKCRSIRADGAVRELHTIARPEFDTNGQLIRYLGVTHDITEQIEAERLSKRHQIQLEELVAERTADLESAKKLAEAANRAKSKFLAAASHDLRQPLTAAKLYLFALKTSSLNDEQLDVAESIENSLESLSLMLNTLLDLAKLEAGKIEAQFTVVEVNDLLRWIKDEFRAQFREKGLTLDFFGGRQGVVLKTDPVLLKGILRNLLVNALKYCEKGRVLVTVRPRGEQALIQIWDTGIGVAPEHIQHIFDEFYQVGNDERDSDKGLGLGLAIVSRQAGLIGAEIRCRSQLGKGTVFDVLVPVVKKISKSRRRHASFNIDGLFSQLFSGKTLVLIEDNRLVRLAVSKALSVYGLNVIAFDGSQAALSDPVITSADYYVSDLRLPGSMDGVQLLASIESMKGSEIKAVVMTGDTLANSKEKAKMGYWKILIKPCMPEEILRALS